MSDHLTAYVKNNLEIYKNGHGGLSEADYMESDLAWSSMSDADRALATSLSIALQGLKKGEVNLLYCYYRGKAYTLLPCGVEYKEVTRPPEGQSFRLNDVAREWTMIAFDMEKEEFADFRLSSLEIAEKT